MQLMTLASELRVEQGIILMGDMYVDKTAKKVSKIEEKVEKKVVKQKRVGGGFMMPKKK